jgi:UDP-N-acetylmuramate--alanine ligase
MPTDRFEPELSDLTDVHIVGVGGAGMSTLALVLSQMGHRVTGSDLRASGVTERLERAGVNVTVGHRSDVVGAAKIVTASPAVPADNPELIEAERKGVTIVTRSAMMSALARLRPTAAVSGTHGKTTTSSMLSLILMEAGLEPSCLLGADVSGIGAGAVWGKGDVLVMEADESYGAFATLRPALTVVTNIEADHLDHYGNLEALEEAFADLLERTSGPRLVISDDPGASRVGRASGVLGVGISEDADIRISDVNLGRAASRFRLQFSQGDPIELAVGSPGLHNVRNAALAAAAASALGAPSEALVAGLARFAGVPRRFEFRGEAAGVTFVDDYAHLPAEVSATLAAAAAGGFERIVAVFQPHRYTRTEAVAASFAGSFDLADEVVVTDVYAAGEPPIPGVSGQLVADAAASTRPGPLVHYAADRRVLVETVLGILRPGDLCITLGAGDLTELPDLLRARIT